jgi:hypothetical protein
MLFALETRSVAVSFLSNPSTWLDCDLMRRTGIGGAVATPLS